MSMDLTQTTQPVQLRVASPQLVAANHILALSSTELQALIHREVEENPAIEMEEVAVCPQCSRPLQGNICPVCSRLARQEPKGPAEVDFADESGMWRRQSTNSDEEFDPTTRVAAQMSLAEHLTLSLAGAVYRPGCAYHRVPGWESGRRWTPPLQHRRDGKPL